MTKYYLLAILFIYVKFCAGQVFVNQNSNGANNGTSWENAYVDLDLAINNTDSNEIWVAKGIYKPSTGVTGAVPGDPRESTFSLKKNVAIYGGFIGNESIRSERDWQKNTTILSGNIGEETDSLDNTYHVVSAEFEVLDTLTILDGLTIRDGYSNDIDGGAGIFIESGGSLIIRNCIIENNYSEGDGGGLYVVFSNPIIENNLFKNNQAFRGGGVYLYYSNAIVKQNEIVNNKADNFERVGSTALYGGGIYVSIYSCPIIKNNLIKGNFALYEGGGVNIDNNYHTVFEGNQVIENSSNKGG